MFPQFQLQSSAKTYQESVQTNEILGSREFEIVRGGTYFEREAHLQNLHRLETHGYDDEEVKSFQAHPSSTRPYFYSGHFHNFRDFSDIKGDNSRSEHSYY